MADERLDGDSGLGESAVDGSGDLGCAGSIAVEAESVGVEGDGGVVCRDDAGVLGDANGLIGGLFGITKQRIGEFAGTQGAVGLVAAVSESFRGDRETGSAKFLEHDGTSEAD